MPALLAGLIALPALPATAGENPKDGEEEGIQVGVDSDWARQLEIRPQDLSPEVVILHFQSSLPKED